MAQRLPDYGETPDGAVQFVRLCVEARPIHLHQTFRRQHLGYLIERESAGPPKRDQCESFQHGWVEQAAQAAPADGGYEALFLVVTQRRGGQARPMRNLGNIQVLHA